MEARQAPDRFLGLTVLWECKTRLMFDKHSLLIGQGVVNEFIANGCFKPWLSDIHHCNVAWTRKTIHQRLEDHKRQFSLAFPGFSYRLTGENYQEKYWTNSVKDCTITSEIPCNWIRRGLFLGWGIRMAVLKIAYAFSQKVYRHGNPVISMIFGSSDFG